jgi:hypothetical protein
MAATNSTGSVDWDTQATRAGSGTSRRAMSADSEMTMTCPGASPRVPTTSACDGSPSAGVCLGADLRRYTVGRQHQHGTRRDLFGLGDEDRAHALETGDDSTCRFLGLSRLRPSPGAECFSVMEPASTGLTAHARISAPHTYPHIGLLSVGPQVIMPDDRWPVAFPGIEGVTGHQACTLIKKCDPVSDR